MSLASDATAPDWRVALNPPIYLVSLLPGLGVPMMAGGDSLHWGALVLATIAVVLLQHAVNLFNDAADWRLGADVEKYDSWVRVHHQRSGLAVAHGAASLLAGGLLGLSVLWQQQQWSLLLIAAPLLLLGYLYNAGPRPLSYTHLGEWVTGICYGPGVFGCLWLVAGGAVDLRLLAGSIAFAALAMGLLLSHQPPQIETDRRAGKRSFAVRYGTDRTHRVAAGLFLLFMVTLALGLLAGGRELHALLLVVLAAVFAVRQRRYAPNPKRILLPASLYVLIGLLLGMVSDLTAGDLRVP